MIKLGEIGQKVFDARYAAKDDSGNIIETFEGAVHRIAKAAASAEKENQERWAEQFVHIIGNLLFIPSTPIWANVGKDDRPWQPGACFVLAVEDDLGSMYQTLKDTAMVFKSGGGVGFNFSAIRPKGDLVRTTKGQASGVVELIRLYDASANMVKQGGVRRGATIGILNIDHPEICDFIQAKLDGGLTNFNLSIGVPDSFMAALDQDPNWQLVFNGVVYQELPAGDLWQMIIESAHACGDPGIVFLDRLQRGNPVPGNFLNATNPCGEQPLSPGESCLLGSVNLARMFNGNGLDRILLEKTVATAIRFLDDLIEVAEYPLPSISEATRATRKIGLGFTGLADALIKTGLPYDDKEGRQFAETVTMLIQQRAQATSEMLAEERGCFPLWEKSIFYPDRKRRNAACVTIAPTGSVTTMAGCEGYGIEPLFAIAYSKFTNVAGAFEVFSPLFLEACAGRVSQEVLSMVAQKGSCQGIQGIPEGIARIFKGAWEIDPEDHILMQAAVQKHVDNAVSKTINLPRTATTEDIGTCYRRAYELGLKGITVFREGSKEGTVMVGQSGARGVEGEPTRGQIVPRPVDPLGTTRRIDTGCGIMYATINYNSKTGEILEAFLSPGPDGGCVVFTEATGIMISTALRGGISIDDVIRKLKRTHACPSWNFARGKGKQLSNGRSCVSAIAHKLEEVKKELDSKYDQLSATRGDSGSPKCPACGEQLQRAEGCCVCQCGYSRC